MFVFLLFFCAVSYTLLPLFQSEAVDSLPHMGYIPFTIDSRNKFWAAYCFQCLLGYLTVIIFASIEILPVNIMQEICIQLEILMNRLLQIPKLRNQDKYLYLNVQQDEYKLLKDCINHHNFILM